MVFPIVGGEFPSFPWTYVLNVHGGRSIADACYTIGIRSASGHDERYSARTAGRFMMRYTLGLAVGLMLPVVAFAQPTTPITGTWSLVALSEDHHGQVTHPLGDKPQGQVIYGALGEVSVILVSSDREKKPGNPLIPVGPVIAYFGTYTVNGNNVINHVTASTYPNFAGTDQKGTFMLNGDTLTLVREIVGGAEPFTSTLEFTRAK
jgi:hypothetical protein